MGKKFNLSLIENEANTQYTDMKGVASIDGHQYSHLIDMCKEHGIDTDNYFLLGLEFSGTDLIGKRNEEYEKETYVYAILISKEDYTFSTYDELRKQIHGLPSVNAKRKSFFIKCDDISKYIKRFKCIVLSDMSFNIQSLNIEDMD